MSKRLYTLDDGTITPGSPVAQVTVLSNGLTQQAELLTSQSARDRYNSHYLPAGSRYKHHGVNVTPFHPLTVNQISPLLADSRVYLPSTRFKYTVPRSLNYTDKVCKCRQSSHRQAHPDHDNHPSGKHGCHGGGGGLTSDFF